MTKPRPDGMNYSDNREGGENPAAKFFHDLHYYFCVQSFPQTQHGQSPSIPIGGDPEQIPGEAVNSGQRKQPMQEEEKAKKNHLEEERLIIAHSGEIPEIAYHSALYYLETDPEGPGLILTPGDLQPLKEAVAERYRHITLRDLNPENRDKGIYRGLARAQANWRRLHKFCRAENIDPAVARREIATALLDFLHRETLDVQQGRNTSINCTGQNLEDFALELGLDPEELPAGIGDLCL